MKKSAMIGLTMLTVALGASPGATATIEDICEVPPADVPNLLNVTRTVEECFNKWWYECDMETGVKYECIEKIAEAAADGTLKDGDACAGMDMDVELSHPVNYRFGMLAADPWYRDFGEFYFISETPNGWNYLMNGLAGDCDKL